MTDHEKAREIADGLAGYVHGERLFELRDDIAAALTAARRDGIEAAALVAERRAKEIGDTGPGGSEWGKTCARADACESVAIRIRALLDAPADSPTPPTGETT